MENELENLDLDAAVDELLAYGTTEGVLKEWDERGRGGHEPAQETSDRIKSESRLSSSPVKSSSELGGGLSETEILNLADGTKGVWKPASGEADEMRDNITGGFQTEREVGAWEVAKLVGMDDLVSPCVQRTIDGKRGALLEFQEGTLAMEHNDPYDGEKDLERAAAFDYVIGNEDRHRGNWILTDKNELRLFDHGLSFPDMGDYERGNDKFIHKMKDNEYDKEYDGEPIRRPSELSEPYVSNAKAIREVLTGLGLPGDAVDGVEQRIYRLANTQKWKDLN